MRLCGGEQQGVLTLSVLMRKAPTLPVAFSHFTPSSLFRAKVLELVIDIANLVVQLLEPNGPGRCVAQQLRSRHGKRTLGCLGLLWVGWVSLD